MVERELYMEKIRSLMDKDIIKVITGIRRCGKSYFLNQIVEEIKKTGVFKENIILINLESGKYNFIQSREELDDIIYNKVKNLQGKVYLLFDEIQNVPDWQISINSYRVDYNCDIYLTGSNSKLLSGELATYIAGRYIEIKMYPFSFKESLLLNSDLTFEEYLLYGGMPFIQNLEAADKLNYLELLYDSILIKDIVYRHNIKNIDLLKRILNYLVDNIGREFSVQNTFNVLKSEKRTVTKDVIYNYLNYLQEAMLIYKVPREDLKGKKLLKFNEKFYFSDWGFNEAIFRNNKLYIAQILENIVFVEFLRRGYKVTVGKLRGSEIDFVCRKNNNCVYVQLSYLLASDETLEREFKPLLAISDNYEKVVISMDKINMSREGIKHLNIEEFLLSEDY